ncbi:MAG TPA: response regulator transcription factor [bacterium (Candidatus Stahlbacteria)]|nr:response regulator transcription factor [Candidatus Stahlbacteria bacterium]
MQKHLEQYHITIVDGKLDDLNRLGDYLKNAGFKISKFQLASDLFKFLRNEMPELIILTFDLPDGDGLEICKILKKNVAFASIPIILLTSPNEYNEKILGLEIGADDCVIKNFTSRELIIRVKRILSRYKNTKGEIKICGNTIVLDVHRYEVKVEGKIVDLTKPEFAILQMLSERKGWVFSRNQILANLRTDKDVLDRTIDVHIRRIRSKLGKAGKLIKTVRGIGYKLIEK